ncbi:MAG: DMT family transporter [Oscillospiraceae bacterium]
MKKQTAIILLIIVTVIWGGGFIGIKMALNLGVSVGLLNMIRGFIFSLLVLIFFPQAVLHMSKPQLKIGLLVGVFNFGGFILQCIGAQYTTPSNSSFLTTTNVVMVPILAWAMYKLRPKIKNFVAIAVCLAGMAILTGALSAKFVLNVGDLYTIAGAFFFALSIVMLAKPPEGGHFAAGAFLLGVTLFLGSAVYFFTVEGGVVPNIDWRLAILPILYLSIGSNFIAQTLQIVAQRHLSASTASLIMVLEGVFGSIFSILFGYEPFTLSLLLGGALIIFSLILSELQILPKNKKRIK